MSARPLPPEPAAERVMSLGKRAQQIDIGAHAYIAASMIFMPRSGPVAACARISNFITGPRPAA